MSQELSTHLVGFRASNNLTQDEMAKLLGIGARTYQTIEVSGIVKKVEYMKAIREKTGYEDTQINASTESSPTNSRTPNEAILSIARSNETLSLANKKIADANFDLVQMLKEATVRAPSENSLSAQSKLAEVLVLIAQIGSGQKKWGSFEEALAEVHKYVDV